VPFANGHKWHLLNRDDEPLEWTDRKKWNVKRVVVTRSAMTNPVRSLRQPKRKEATCLIGVTNQGMNLKGCCFAFLISPIQERSSISKAMGFSGQRAASAIV
jgi:hypothetical protein